MREREAQRVERARGSARREDGFTIIQMVITCAVIAIAATFAVMGIASARTSMRVQSSARQFAGYLEKARSDAIRRHGNSTVQITSANATSYIVTMDFNLDGATESRVISLEDEVIINHDAVTLTFDWRGRLTTDGISLSFEGPGGNYPVQLDVTGSGDVTIGEEKFLDSEVPAVTLNNGGAGGDVLNDVAAISPTTPTTPPVTTPPVTIPPVTTPPVTTPPVTTPPVTLPPVTTPPPTSPPGGGNPGHGNQPPSTTPPPSTPPPTTPPPATTPSTPPVGTSCSMTLSTTQATIRACNNAGNNCGSTTVVITLTFPPAGTTVTASAVPSNLEVPSPTSVGSVYTFTIRAKNNTRTTNSVTFSGCGSEGVSITTN